jgi:hypothetical protein
MSNLEHLLTGGNVADRVVRIGETVTETICYPDRNAAQWKSLPERS